MVVKTDLIMDVAPFRLRAERYLPGYQSASIMVVSPVLSRSEKVD